VNDEMRELKGRLRQVETVLTERGSGGTERVVLAQAVSRARRLLKHADRTRAPSSELRASVEEAEGLAAPVR
jgi:hypothetical protein